MCYHNTTGLFLGGRKDSWAWNWHDFTVSYLNSFHFFLSGSSLFPFSRCFFHPFHSLYHHFFLSSLLAFFFGFTRFFLISSVKFYFPYQSLFSFISYFPLFSCYLSCVMYLCDVSLRSWITRFIVYPFQGWFAEKLPQMDHFESNRTFEPNPGTRFF